MTALSELPYSRLRYALLALLPLLSMSCGSNSGEVQSGLLQDSDSNPAAQQTVDPEPTADPSASDEVVPTPFPVALQPSADYELTPCSPVVTRELADEVMGDTSEVGHDVQRDESVAELKENADLIALVRTTSVGEPVKGIARNEGAAKRIEAYEGDETALTLQATPIENRIEEIYFAARPELEELTTIRIIEPGCLGKDAFDFLQPGSLSVVALLVPEPGIGIAGADDGYTGFIRDRLQVGTDGVLQPRESVFGPGLSSPLLVGVNVSEVDAMLDAAS